MEMSPWKDVPVLVTGGAGFIGSNLAHRLLKEGAKVSVLDIKPWYPDVGSYYDDLRKQTNYIEGSVTNSDLLEKTLRKGNIQCVFHLAAVTIVGDAITRPAETLDVNIRGTWNLLELLRTSFPGVRMVVASSDKAYGSQPILPYTEATPTNDAEHPYSCSKSCVDLISRTYAHAYGLPVSVTRCGNAYGPGDLNFSRLIPDTIRTLHRGEAPLIRSDGTFLRDYVYVDDLVEAYLCSARALETTDIAGEAFNFGQNDPKRVLEVVKEIMRLMNTGIAEPVIQNTVKNEIKDQYLDSSYAMSRLGWKSSVTFSEGLEKSIEWYSAFLDRRPQYVRG